MAGCAAFGCSNRSEQGYKLHRFPKDPVRRKKWSIKVKRDKWKPSSTTFLCERHFLPNDYLPGEKRLKKTAVPTIFSHTLLTTPKRKCPSERNHIRTAKQIKENQHSARLDHNYCKEKKFNVKSNDTNASPNVSIFANEVNKANMVFESNHRNDLLLQQVICPQSALEIQEAIVNTAESVPNHIHLEYLKMRNENDRLKRQINVMETSLKFLTDDQKTFLDKSKNEHWTWWSNETIKRALQLRFACGTSGYETLLRQGYPLPSICTLQRHTEHIDFESGIVLAS